MCSRRRFRRAPQRGPSFLTEKDMTRFDRCEIPSATASRSVPWGCPSRAASGAWSYDSIDRSKEKTARSEVPTRSKPGSRSTSTREAGRDGRIYLLPPSDATRRSSAPSSHLPPVQEQPALNLRSSRGQDRDCRRARAQDRARRYSAWARQRDGALAPTAATPANRNALPRPTLRNVSRRSRRQMRPILVLS